MNLNSLLTKLNPFKKVLDKKVLDKKVESNIQEANSSESDESEVGIKEVEIKNDATLKREKAVSLKMWTLSEMDKQILVSLWASGLTSSEVVEEARNQHNIKISAVQVVNYSKSAKWQPLIKKIREATYSDLSTIAGSHKKVRLSRHEKIYEKAITKNKLDLAIKATEHQRKEMEGDSSNFSLTMNQFNVLSDEELENKKKQVLDRIKLMSTKGEI